MSKPVNPEPTNTNSAPHRLLDASGLYCPEPVMMLHNVIREMKVDDIVQVTATDPSTKRDIPKFCQFLGHELLAQECVEQVYVYRIRKAKSADST